MSIGGLDLHYILRTRSNFHSTLATLHRHSTLSAPCAIRLIHSNQQQIQDAAPSLHSSSESDYSNPSKNSTRGTNHRDTSVTTRISRAASMRCTPQKRATVRPWELPRVRTLRHFEIRPTTPPPSAAPCARFSISRGSAHRTPAAAHNATVRDAKLLLATIPPASNGTFARSHSSTYVFICTCF